LLRVARRSYFVASAAVFAVLYAILGLFPVSAYIGVGSFLTFREVVSPLSGMIFGPLTGGFSMIIGNFVDFAFGKPVVFDFLDFVPDLASAVLAGLVFTGRRKAAIVFPLVLIALYSLDPLALPAVQVGGISVPFLWMHLLSVAVLGVALIYEAMGKLDRLHPAFVAATVFASTMAGHVAGSIVYINVLGRINGVLSAQELAANFQLIFYAYPAERLLFLVLGTLIAVPVLRTLARRKGASPAFAKPQPRS
jgi:hypothetical protein